MQLAAKPSCPLAGSAGHRRALWAQKAPRQGRSGPRQLRCRPSASSRRDRVQPTSSASAGLAVPLDYYRLLGVSGVCSRDSLARALEKALTNPPGVGYSQQCLLARGSALKRAVETLLDPQARHKYDDSLRVGEITEEVPDEFVPGVLALLLESGEAQTVVAAGEEWLSTHRRDSRVRDVALSTALAHKAVAETCLKKHGDAVSASGMLRVAGDLLRRHHAAPALQAEVATALAELQPALACQLVALPLEQFQEREHGVQVAISVLTNTSGAKRGMGKQQFLDKLTDSLTAAEQIEVFEAAGVRYAELPSELYDVALAYIADAASSGRAAQLDRALAALEAAASAVPPGATGQASDSGVRQLAERRAIDDRHRRQVAYAVCQLLLGQTAAAADTLGLMDGSTAKCERSILAFIKANSPDREDSLPGMCVLAQRWVADVALASFRGTQGTPFSLEAWFELDPVRRYLSRRDDGFAASHPSLAAAQRVGAVLAAPFVDGLAAVLDLMGLLVSPERQGPEAGGEDSDYGAEEAKLGMDGSPAAGGLGSGGPGRRQSLAAQATEAQSRFEQTSAAAEPVPPQQGQMHNLPAAQARVPAGRSPAEVAAAAAASDMSRVDMRTSRSTRPAPKPTPRELQPRHTARPELTTAANTIPPPPAPVAMPPPVPEAAAGEEFDANIAFAMQPIEQLAPLDGEERMWDSVEQRNVRWGRLAATVALLAGGGFLLGRGMLMRQHQLTAAAAAAAPPPAAVAVAAPQAAPAAPLTRTKASAVIGRWQGIKAAALGPQHDIQGLSTILRGDVLGQWQERAQQIQSKGWHYLHTMEASQINSVEMAADGSAHVSATFREAVQAHRGVSEPMQAFRSEYSVDYELVREGGSWVIVGAVVRY